MKLLDNKIFFLIKEYEKLKDEQNKRIEFRDHMIYITLGVIGGVFSFVLEKPEFISALLVLPFVNIILGWTYFMNDQKVTEIGSYVKNVLIPKIDGSKSASMFSLIPSWEDFHKHSNKRKEKKIIQLILDLMLFCISSVVSICIFFNLNTETNGFHITFIVVELIAIIYLAIHFIIEFRLIKY